jgi:hypothetical protein
MASLTGIQNDEGKPVNVTVPCHVLSGLIIAAYMLTVERPNHPATPAHREKAAQGAAILRAAGVWRNTKVTQLIPKTEQLRLEFHHA